MNKIEFTVRLNKSDWAGELKAWRCPALDIPSAFIQDAFNSEGDRISLKELEIEKGPARVSWRGGTPPAQITLSIGLAQTLSTKSKVDIYKYLAIVLTPLAAVASAFITAYFGYTPPRPPHPPHVIRLTVNPTPNDLMAGGLPEAVIKLNGVQYTASYPYNVSSDISGEFDIKQITDLAIRYRAAYKTQSDVLVQTISTHNGVLSGLQALAGRVNGNICSGGNSGVASPIRGDITREVNALQSQLSSATAALQAQGARTP